MGIKTKYDDPNLETERITGKPGQGFVSLYRYKGNLFNGIIEDDDIGYSENGDNKYQIFKDGHHIKDERYLKGKLVYECNLILIEVHPFVKRITRSRDGIEREWYDNGQLKYYATNNKNGHTDGLSKRWYENGQLKYVGLIKNDGSENLNEFGFIINKKSGVWEYYYENGRLESKKVYREGKLISQKCWDKYGSEIECE